jgi:hypothetical protein
MVRMMQVLDRLPMGAEPKIEETYLADSSKRKPSKRKPWK